jgi:anti-anti-sigma factor
VVTTVSGPGDLAQGGVADGGSISVDHLAAITTVVLHGEIDAALSGRLDALRAQADAAGYPVTLDVTRVSFMDSTGVAFLVRLHRSVAPHPVTILRPTAAVRYLLEVTQLTQVFRIEDGRPG